jgi:ribosomal protein S18 acetylase RimI-like enzyme
MSVSMWRMARPEEDDSIVEMGLELQREDPGFAAISNKKMRATLAKLRREPHRGRAVVLAIERQLAGYALLISFWSNELGGEICEVDELFVLPEWRNQGHGRALFKAIAGGDLFASPIAAITLGVTLNNARAKRLYERLGFKPAGVLMVRALDAAP